MIFGLLKGNIIKINKMKKILVLRVMVLTLLFHLPVLAQDNDTCMQDLSIFAEFAKVKNYKSFFIESMSLK